MTEFEKADANKNGAIEKSEWALLELEDRRRRLDDEDLKRNAERRFTGLCWGLTKRQVSLLISPVCTL